MTTDSAVASAAAPASPGRQDAGAPWVARLETVAWWLLPLFVFVLPLSVAASAILLTALIAVWIGLAVAVGERPAVPGFFWPLTAYAGWTLVSVAFSIDPAASLIESREVLLFLTVPVVYRLAQGERAWSISNVVLTAGAVTAAIGIVQYGILEFDTLGRRPSGSMGHYMTYAGLLMLVLGVAVSRVAFGTRDRLWAGLILPALVAALVVTLTRSAWLGAIAAVGLLVVLRDRRLLLFAPVAALLLYLVAPATVTDRALSIFDPSNPTNRDRVAMLTVGAGMVRDHPLIGVGPEMVFTRYAEYRPANAVNEVNAHLHNVPVQIAAERGLPALALWGWFVIAVVLDLARRFRRPETRTLAAAGLAAVAAMLVAGQFEYNFGDSEFLSLFLVLITLPAAAAISPGAPRAPASRTGAPASRPASAAPASRPASDTPASTPASSPPPGAPPSRTGAPASTPASDTPASRPH